MKLCAILFLVCCFLQFVTGCHYAHCISKRGVLHRGICNRPSVAQKNNDGWTHEALAEELDNYGIVGALKTCVLNNLVGTTVNTPVNSLLVRREVQLTSIRDLVEQRLASVQCQGYEDVCRQVERCASEIFQPTPPPTVQPPIRGNNLPATFLSVDGAEDRINTGIVPLRSNLRRVQQK
uniref:Uncharacterized LOC100181188 n=1 Tax=Ciona intestinalis TaxID=7719 RepID=F6TYP7_CIOIN|nr:uncharacterized protein LOC100181188 [Ciona intestinalis]|eukprot:XP_002128460.1 uncharacterized protein LOC100181188 [Ciona intestinalis]